MECTLAQFFVMWKKDKKQTTCNEAETLWKQTLCPVGTLQWLLHLALVKREYLASQIRSMNSLFHIATNKSSANREVPLFSRLYPSFGYFRKIFRPRSLKYSLFWLKYTHKWKEIVSKNNALWTVHGTVNGTQSRLRIFDNIFNTSVLIKITKQDSPTMLLTAEIDKEYMPQLQLYALKSKENTPCRLSRQRILMYLATHLWQKKWKFKKKKSDSKAGNQLAYCGKLSAQKQVLIYRKCEIQNWSLPWKRLYCQIWLIHLCWFPD